MKSKFLEVFALQVDINIHKGVIYSNPDPHLWLPLFFLQERKRKPQIIEQTAINKFFESSLPRSLKITDVKSLPTKSPKQVLVPQQKGKKRLREESWQDLLERAKAIKCGKHKLTDTPQRK